MQARYQSFSGPLPPSSELQRYDDVLPGLADRIVRMAEEQGTHRRKLEETYLDGRMKNERVGQWLGFACFMVTIVLGFVLVYVGKDAWGISSIVAALTALVGVFVYGKSQQAKELAGKRQELDGKPASAAE